MVFRSSGFLLRNYLRFFFKEEDEETVEFKNSSINKYMANKSAFDKLYNKIISENVDMKDIKTFKTMKFISVQDTNIDAEVFENLYDGWTGKDITGQYISVDTLEQISDEVFDMQMEMEDGGTIDEEEYRKLLELEKEFQELEKIDKELHILF